MPTRPGMTVWPWRSMTAVLGAAVVSLEMLVILPFSMRMDWSSSGAAPVPSMMRTWVRRTEGALTLTYLRTSGESWDWAWRARVANRDAARVRLGRMKVLRWDEFILRLGCAEGILVRTN